MALESATYISDLVSTNPVGATDTKATLDDHIRLLKSTVKATFPNISGAVTPTHTELNYVDGVTSAIQTQLDAKAPLASPTLTGTPLAPTAAAGTSTTQIATTAFVAGTAFASALPAQTGNSGKYVTTDGTTASWAEIANGITRSARTSNTILGVADKGDLIDITSGTFAQTFSAAATLGDGWFCYIRNSGTGDITLTPNGAETIDGLTSFVMYPGEARVVQCDGSVLRSVVLKGFTKTFTASGDFIKPPGYGAFEGLMWGGGGSGRKHSTSSNKSGGGGGGCVPFSFIESALSATEAVVIGAGGTAISADATDGIAGGDSTFNGLTAYGGPAGTNSGVLGGTAFTTAAIAVCSSTGGATASVAAFYGGGAGLVAAGVGHTIHGGGGGGGVTSGDVLIAATATMFGGAGGAGVVAGAGGVAGTAPGGGGGATKTGTASGAGARGELRIWGK